MTIQEQIDKILEAIPEDATDRIFFNINFNVTPEGVEVIPPVVPPDPPPAPTGKQYQVDVGDKPSGREKVRAEPSFGSSAISFVYNGYTVTLDPEAPKMGEFVRILKGVGGNGIYLAGWVTKAVLVEVE